MIDWGVKYAAIYKSTKGMLKPVEDIDFVDIDSLYGLEKQKEILLKNTRNFIAGDEANHVLLWGFLLNFIKRDFASLRSAVRI